MKETVEQFKKRVDVWEMAEQVILDSGIKRREDLIESLVYFNNCYWARICPYCGAGAYDKLTEDGGMKFHCKNCGFLDITVFISNK